MDKRLFWIDCLRVLACFGVVWLHSGAVLLDKVNKISGFDWWVCNVYFNSMRWRIPIFLMISGAVILPKIYGSLREYLNKRVLRLVYPFVFWSLMYIPLQLYLKHRTGELAAINPIEYIFVGLRDGVSHYFWYIYLIIGLNLFFPVLGRWIRGSTAGEIRYFLTIWLVTVFAALPFVEQFIPKVELKYFAGYIGFPVLGYYIANKTWSNTKKIKWIAISMIVTGCAIALTVTHIMSQAHGRFWGGVLGNQHPVSILMATGIFLLFKHLNFGNGDSAFHTVIRFLSKYTYGVYLVHSLTLTVLWRFGIYAEFVHPIFGVPITAILCFSLSILIVWTVNKLPFGKYISG
jgi:surface polysaccharide O-acyltransferase-like enzyme